jgi:hypothetical protein
MPSPDKKSAAKKLASSAENGMQGMGEIEGLIDNVNGTIDDLDTKLDKVLKRQEQDYLKGYTIYVKQKEKEL